MCCCSCNLEPIQFYIGDGGDNTPIDGDICYINPNLKYTKYLISKNGFGHLIEGRDYERIVSGGFFLLSSITFITDETYTITPYN